MGNTVRGGEVESVKKLKQELKKGGGSPYHKVPEDGAVTGRFLTEPNPGKGRPGWYKFYEHYEDGAGFYPCTGNGRPTGDCDGCDNGDKASLRYLANFLDADENKVVPLYMPQSLAKRILKWFDKNKTILDRDYELTRVGTGYDTEYDAMPETPKKRKLERYEDDLIDLEAVVQAQVAGDDDDDDDEPKGKKGKKSKSGVKKGKGMKRPKRDDDDDDRPSPRKGKGNSKKPSPKGKSKAKRSMSRK